VPLPKRASCSPSPRLRAAPAVRADAPDPGHRRARRRQRVTGQLKIASRRWACASRARSRSCARTCKEGLRHGLLRRVIG
jgi:hypothetical protein